MWVGSVTIEDRGYLAPGAGVRDQVSVVPNAFIGKGAVVTNQISEPGTYIGILARWIEKSMSGDER
jgi:serine acetyltransferase